MPFRIFEYNSCFSSSPSSPGSAPQTYSYSSWTWFLDQSASHLPPMGTRDVCGQWPHSVKGRSLPSSALCCWTDFSTRKQCKWVELGKFPSRLRKRLKQTTIPMSLHTNHKLCGKTEKQPKHGKHNIIRTRETSSITDARAPKVSANDIRYFTYMCVCVYMPVLQPC